MYKGIVLFSGIGLCFLVSRGPANPVEDSMQQYQGKVEITMELGYLLSLPEGYGEEKEKKWSLILFLHGMGERGDDLDLVKKHGPPKLVEQGREFPFVIVSPQCPADLLWSNSLLVPVLDEIVAGFSIDEDRIYVTGLSMGGYGTWALAGKCADRFAAVAPICGSGDPGKASDMRNLPVWVFHGAKDDVVPVEESEKMVRALEECGGNVKFTVYPEATHDSWTETYDNPELYEWFLSHRRGE